MADKVKAPRSVRRIYSIERPDHRKTARGDTVPLVQGDTWLDPTTRKVNGVWDGSQWVPQVDSIIDEITGNKPDTDAELA